MLLKMIVNASFASDPIHAALFGEDGPEVLEALGQEAQREGGQVIRSDLQGFEAHFNVTDAQAEALLTAATTLFDGINKSVQKRGGPLAVVNTHRRPGETVLTVDCGL